jgi:phosphoenolpyruvate-protein phosphotransferase
VNQQLIVIEEYPEEEKLKSAERTVIKGIPAAPGLAHGKMVIVKKEALDIPQLEINDSEKELKRLMDACRVSQDEINALKEDVDSRSSKKEAEIFEAHRMILDDVSLIERARKAIENRTNAEKAWMDAIEYFAQMMEQIPDETLSSRSVDIRDVGHRVLGHLLGISTTETKLKEPSIVIGDDLTPSDTVSLDKELVLGFCTASGGPTSHTAILAKAFGLPAVVGMGKDILSVSADSILLVDGESGVVIINPAQDELAAFKEREIRTRVKLDEIRAAAQSPAVTADGERVEVVANIGGVEDAPLGIRNGAEGVGLFRTEFLYLDRNSLPSEAEQIEAYREVFNNYPKMPVVVRTLDIGGDKVIPYLDLPQELNPFLGWRGIRMLDGAEEIFLSQFRALLQAGVGIDLRIMVPMVSSIMEIRSARTLMDRAKVELREEKKDFNKDIQFGIMVEVPSAALLADRLAKEVDFFSIGTNDLTQYTLAVDRTNSRIAHLASPMNPAVLTLIQHTIRYAHSEGKWVGLCGELAGEPLAAPILLGLGLDEFSMSPARVPVIKQVMAHLRKADCEPLAEEVLKMTEERVVVERSRAFLAGLGLTF